MSDIADESRPIGTNRVELGGGFLLYFDEGEDWYEENPDPEHRVPGEIWHRDQILTGRPLKRVTVLALAHRTGRYEIDDAGVLSLVGEGIETVPWLLEAH